MVTAMADLVLKKANEIETERKAFKADRIYDRGRITYMAHGKGYVMVRYPGCIPFAISEKEWQVLPPYVKAALNIQHSGEK